VDGIPHLRRERLCLRRPAFRIRARVMLLLHDGIEPHMKARPRPPTIRRESSRWLLRTVARARGWRLSARRIPRAGALCQVMELTDAALKSAPAAGEASARLNRRMRPPFGASSIRNSSDSRCRLFTRARSPPGRPTRNGENGRPGCAGFRLSSPSCRAAAAARHAKPLSSAALIEEHIPRPSDTAMNALRVGTYLQRPEDAVVGKKDVTFGPLSG